MKYLALTLILVSGSAFGQTTTTIDCCSTGSKCNGVTYGGTAWVNNPAEIKMDMVVIDRSEKVMLYRGVKECQAAASSLLGSSDVKTALCFK